MATVCRSRWQLPRLSTPARGTADAALTEILHTSRELAWIDTEYAIALPVGTDHLLVDLMAACRALGEAHARPPGGADANEWTRLFEDQVQSIIDRSPWKPSDHARVLIRRQIKVDGEFLTDIDAVAERDGELILIDVKSLTTPPNLQFGEFWAVNDRLRTVTSAVVEWQEKVDVLRRHPEVLGIEIPSSIYSLVVTPEVPYVEGGPCTTEVVAGLLAVSTMAELDRCLNPDSYWTTARSSRSDL